RRRLSVRERDCGRIDPAAVYSGGRERDPGGDGAGRPGGLPDRGRQGEMLRRIVPRRGLFRAGVQDGGQPGLPGGGGEGEPGAAGTGLERGGDGARTVYGGR